MLDDAAAIRLLREGDIEIVGRLVESTNNALFCTVTRHCPDPEPDEAVAAVYKPTIGERPLDDFPDGTLTRREVAAYAVSEVSGWRIAPPTVLRDGPFGDGMLQLWIDVDDAVDPIALVVDSDPRLRRIAVFDAVVNNTDRKAGHLLPDATGHVWGVDHGVCFSAVPKLRTVLWGWRGQQLTDEECEVLVGLRDEMDGELGDRLRELLHPVEVAVTVRRIDRLLDAPRFPQPDPRRPALPWPPV